MGVVDALVEPQGAQALEALVARRGGEHSRPGPLGELDGGDADAAGAGLDEDGLTRLEVAELEQAVVGGAERHRDAGGGHNVGAVGDGPCHQGGDGDELGVGARQHGGDDPLADPAVLDALADLPDRAGALVADDVGRRRHLPTAAVESVAALDADGLDLDEHAPGEDGGVGHVLIAEDVGRTGLVVHGCLHRRRLYGLAGGGRPRRCLTPLGGSAHGNAQP